MGEKKSLTFTLHTLILVAVIAVAGGFFGGKKFSKLKSAGSGDHFTGDFRNPSPEERSNFRQRSGGGGRFGGAGRSGGFRGAEGFTGGEVVSVDEGSITVKTQDGSTKLILFTDKTEMSKQAEATFEDLVEGTNVMVGGESNDDGSMTANFLQIRPDQPSETMVKEESEKE